MLLGLFQWNSLQDVSAEIKKKIFKTLEKLHPKIERVSVVQNCPIDLIIKNFLGNPSETIIQLHGDEDIDYCKKIREKIPNIGLWKAFRIKTEKDIAVSYTHLTLPTICSV